MREMPRTFAQMIETFPLRKMEKALTFYHGDCEAQLSYGELYAAIRGWGGLFCRKWSMRPGARIAMCAYNETDVVPITLSIIALGCTLVPLNPDSDITFLDAVLEQVQVDAVLLGEDIPQQIREYLNSRTVNCMTIDDTIRPDAASVRWASPDVSPEVSLLLFTSGTTGKPKGVALTQSALIENATSLVKNFKLDGVPQLAVMPLFHAHAFGFGLLTSLLSGGHLVLARGVDPAVWKRAIQEQKVVYTSVVPPLLQMLLRMRVKQSDLPSLKGILVSSAPLTVELAAGFVKYSGIRLIHGWGLSEYTNFACCMQVDQDASYYTDCISAHQWPTVGHALSSTRIQIRDGDGVEVPQGEIGELWVQGPSMMRSYFNNQEATEKAINNGWLRTGDLGYCADSGFGLMYFITGRLKEIIIRAGEKVAPAEIEERLCKVMPIWDGAKAVVVGYSHKQYGEEIGLYMHHELNIGANAVLEALNKLHVSLRPKIVIIGGEPVPMTHTGKVQRLKLQKYFNEYYEYSGPVKLVVNEDACQAGETGLLCKMN